MILIVIFLGSGDKAKKAMKPDLHPPDGCPMVDLRDRLSPIHRVLDLQPGRPVLLKLPFQAMVVRTWIPGTCGVGYRNAI